MKAITLVLSILMLSLAIKPCSDAFNAEHYEQEQTSTQHDHSQDSDDSCPSLCICNCCGVLITFQEIASFKLFNYVPISNKVVINYSQEYSFNYLSSIWQPPRLNC